MKRLIRLGDLTTHGGVVISASSSYEVLGRPVARVGDRVTCPMQGHGLAVIIEGDPDWLIDGRPVALEGHLTSCGATLIATVASVGRE